MTAESYLDQIGVNNNTETSALMFGNNHPSFQQSGVGPTTDLLPGTTRMTTTQAEDFLARYEIVSHLPNTASGFSGTLMRKIVDGKATDAYTLAFRSTEYLSAAKGGDRERDFGTNIEIGAQGFAFGQIASMEGYYEHLTAGQSFNAISGQWENDTALDDFSRRFGIDNVGGTLNVSGYSLSGNLANVFTALHPEVDHTYVFNATGLGNIGQGDLRTMVDNLRFRLDAAGINLADPSSTSIYGPYLLPEIYPEYQNIVDAMQLNYDTSYKLSSAERGLSSDEITQLYGKDAQNKIIQLYGEGAHNDHQVVANTGQHVLATKIYIEDQPSVQNWALVGDDGDFGKTHSITLLVDSLAVMSVFEKLSLDMSTSLGLETAYDILAAGTAEYAFALLGTDGIAERDSLETIVTGLHKLLVGSDVTLSSDGGVKGFSNLTNREEFYKALDAIDQKIATATALKLESLVGKTADDLIRTASGPDSANNSATAYRYALKELNPFAVIGADYTAHNLNGELDLYVDATGQGTMSSQYLMDRAGLLAEVIEINTQDLTRNAIIDGTVTYSDKASDVTLLSRAFGPAVVDYAVTFGNDDNGMIPESLPGGVRADHIYGLGGDDIITGGSGNDYLEGNAGYDQLGGGAGFDQLWGGAGNDILVGGKGNDRLNGGLGFDTYGYQEGGRVNYDGGPGVGWLWNEVDGDGIDAITDPDGLGEIHFTTKEGITHVLNGGREVAPNSDIWQSVDTNGDFDGQFTYQYIADIADLNNGTLIVNGGAITIKGFARGELGINLPDASAPLPPPPDRRVGTASFDGLYYNFQNTAEVTFEGLDGPDVLQGGRFDDALYGDAEATFASLDSLAPSSLQGDFVSGEAGDDLVVGSNAIDVLSGGPGSDELYSGPGDDLIYGDFGAVGQYSSSIGPQWQIVRQNNPFQTYVHGAFGGANEASWLGGADTIYSGSGNDTVFAGGQDDVVYGGSGDDVIGGDDGDDTLFGEADDDLLMGDRPDQYTDFVAGQLYVNSGNDSLDGGGGNDQLWGLRGNDYLYGGIGNDVLRGDSATPWFASPPLVEHGDDFLRGDDGKDTLYGDGGDDTLVGGVGNDILVGGAGDDTFLFSAGDGADTLIDEAGDDNLLFGAGITLADVSLAGQAVGRSQSMVLTVGSAGDSITLVEKFGGIDHIQFANGASYTLRELARANDGLNLSGSDSDDTLDSVGLFSMLAGGTGNDTLLGGTDSTTYQFDPGDGADFINEAGGLDTIAFGQGITSNDISWRYNPGAPGGAFVIDVGSAGDQIAISDGENGAVEQFRFANGTRLSFDALLARQGGLQATTQPQGIIFDGSSLAHVPYVAGSAGADLIFDFDQGDVTYIAGRGDDYLEIYQGDGYRFVFNTGDGTDVINSDSASNETIVFGPGITPDAVQFALARQSYHRYDQYAANPFPVETAYGLKISYGDQGDSVFVVDGAGQKQIETFEFADGQRLSYNQMLGSTPVAPLTSFAQAGGTTLTTGDDFYVGYTDITGADYGATGQSVDGLTGNDVIITGGGDDTIYGGTGFDILQGGLGIDDLYADYDYVDYANDLLDGGADDDYLDASLGNDLLIGGTGDDLIWGDIGNDVILFNRGDGRDRVGSYASEVVAPALRPDTLSLGGGIRYSDLALKNFFDADLHLETGQGEAVDLYLWYWDADEDKAVSTLQIVIEGTADYDPQSADPMVNQKVQRFDFRELVRQFEAAAVLDPTIQSWSLENALPSAYLGGSDTAAIGGDLAYLYATQGEYDHLPLQRVNNTLTDASFGLLQNFSPELLADINAPAPAQPTLDLGSGRQTLSNPGLRTTLQVGAGIVPTDITVTRDTVDLLITHSNQTDEVRVQGWYANGNGQFLQMQFDDGSVISPRALSQAGLTVSAPDAGGTLVGLWNQPNTLIGGAGNDVVTGGVADDLINGGAGNDTLNGGGGHDTYVFNPGDGVDTINDVARPSAGNSVVFGAGISYTSSFSLGLGSLLLRVGDQGDEIHLTNFDQSDVYGPRTVESFTFADGTTLSYDQLLARGFDLFGTAGDDTITGTNITDRIDGLAGNDTLLGGAGSDTYLFGPGSRQDVIREAAATGDVDTLQVLANPADVIVTRENNDIVVNLTATSDRVAIDWFTDPAARIEQVSFTDGTVWNGAALEAQIQEINQPPIVANALADQSTNEDALFNYQIPADAFSDVDAGDNLSYTATLSDGTALPGWLSFDASTRSFSGKPLNDDVGIIDVQVTATDLSGASASDVFALDVANTNDAPLVANALTDQSTSEDALFNYQVPTNAFADIDAGDTLSYSAALPDDSPLPGWLNFDSATRSFSGIPTNDEVGTLRVRVSATDSGNLSVSDDFDIAVANTNDAPTLVNAIADQAATEDTAFSFIVPANAFADVDIGDALSYTATLADGTALPDWLRFDAATRRFGGTPENADVGSVDVRVIATDVAGTSASDVFALSVANVNDAPVANNDAISAYEDGAPLSVPLATLLANDSDIDVGDILSVTAASNSVAGAMVIIDTAAAAVVYDVGGLFQSLAQGQSTIDTFSYTVSDTAGATSTAAVQVTVNGVNDAPVANADDVSIFEGDSSGNLVAALLANDTDIDNGDVRKISAVDTLGTLGMVTFDSLTQSLDYSAAGANFDALGTGATASDLFTYTVSDATGATSTATVNVTVDGVNDAPALVSEIADQAALEDNPFTFQVPHGSFTDVDSGDVLSYRSSLADGLALPDWLSFDAAHLTFSGMPFYENAGTITISVTATDLAGVSTTGLFDLSVNLYPDLVLIGGAGNDTLIGHSGNDQLDGSAGDDTMIGAHGDDTYVVDSNSDAVIELLDQGIDTVITPLSYTLGENVENLTLTGNGKKVHATGNASDNVLVGNDKKNTLTGLAGNDWLDGGADDDKMAGGTGDDTYVVDNKKDKVIENAGEGTDTVRSVIKWDLSDDVENLILVGTDKIDGKGNDLDNLLVGNSAKNKLDGKDGNDIIQGLAGDDDLKSKSGSVLMDGGAGDDKLDGSRDNELYIGGVGDDEIKPDKGADVIAFNRGDGRDQVKHAHDGGNTLSLGGGIAYDDLKLSRQNNDLIFDTGAGEGINFADWYMGDHKSVINLQVVAEAMAQFDANSSDPLLKKKVQTFDFGKVVGAFEAAGQVDNWALTNALLDAHLAGSDSEALGGDLAYQYGVNGSLSGIGVSATQDVLNAPQFGTGAQTLRPIDQLNQDKNKLA